jgi:hypothetical protein
MKHLILLTVWIFLSAAPASSEVIVLRCNGMLERFYQSGENDNPVLLDGLLFKSELPYSLRDDPRVKVENVNRIFSITPGYYIETNALGSAEGPGDKDIWLHTCKIENNALYCKKDEAFTDTMIDNFYLSVIPPFSVTVRSIFAVSKQGEDDEGNWLVGTYSFKRFSSMDCERINPMPPLAEWAK